MKQRAESASWTRRVPAVFAVMAIAAGSCAALTMSVQPVEAAFAASVIEDAPAWQTERVTIDEGHVDMFHVSPKGDGIDLGFGDSRTPPVIVRDPASVAMVVKDIAKVDVPEGFIEGLPASGYALPWTQDPNLLWPGWSSESLPADQFESVTYDMDASGPGKVWSWVINPDGQPETLLDNGSFTLPGTTKPAAPNHTHVNWFFGTPGLYEFTVTAHAVRASDKSVVSSPKRRYRMFVDAPVTWPAPTATATATATATTTATTTATATATTTATATATTTATATATSTATAPTTSTATSTTTTTAPTTALPDTQCRPVRVPQSRPVGRPAPVTAGHFDLGPAVNAGSLAATLKDDRSVPPVYRSTNEVAFALGDAAKKPAVQQLSFLTDPQRQVWMIGTAQEANVPWLGLNTQRGSLSELSASGTADLRLVEVKGPGKVALVMPGTFGASLQRLLDNVGGPSTYTVAAHTHMHPTWVFTEPGYYDLTMEQRVVDAAGKPHTVMSTLLFDVGNDAERSTHTVGQLADGTPCELDATAAGNAPGGGAHAAPNSGSQPGGSVGGAAAGAVGASDNWYGTASGGKPSGATSFQQALARTGASLGALIGLAMGILAAGVGLTVFVRRFQAVR